MRYFTPNHTLVYYDGPQLLLGQDGYGGRYLALAVPSTGEVTASFLAVGISDARLDDYLSESIDLRSVFRRPKTDRYFTFSIAANNSGRYPMTVLDQIADDMLPSAGFFASQHTESMESEAKVGMTTVKIPIDGRWDMQDLAQFPNKYTDTYAFLYAVNHSTDVAGVESHLGELFQKYPWRGGFSSVGFYNDLYRAIPKPQRLRIREIHYASPGAISLDASSVLSGQIQSLVRGVNDRWREISDAYSELYDGMKQRGFLGVSIREVTADAEDKAFLRRACKGLASAMQFEGGEQVHTLCGRNWVATSKILLSFYRRVTDLAEYYESGKVSMPLSS